MVCRCGNLTTAEALEANMTSQRDDESVRKHLNLPPSSGGDVTVECVARNQMGAFRKVFHHRMLLENIAVVFYSASRMNQHKNAPFYFSGKLHTAFMPALIGAVSTAAILFLLLLVVFYKWRQVREQ